MLKVMVHAMQALHMKFRSVLMIEKKRPGELGRWEAKGKPTLMQCI